MIELANCQTADEVRAHYKALRARTLAWREPPAQPRQAPKTKMPEPEPAPEPRVTVELTFHIPPKRAHEIFAEVCRKYSLRPEMVSGRLRTQAIAFARQEFCYRAAAETQWSYPQIGKFLGRDHTTVMYAIGAHALRHDLPHPRDPNYDNNKIVAKRRRFSEWAAVRTPPKPKPDIACEYCRAPMRRVRVGHRWCSNSCRGRAKREAMKCSQNNCAT